MEFIIPKTELEKNPQLSHQLTQLSSAITELPDHCLYVPLAGKQLEIVTRLIHYRIVYAVQYGHSSIPKP